MAQNNTLTVHRQYAYIQLYINHEFVTQVKYSSAKVRAEIIERWSKMYPIRNGRIMYFHIVPDWDNHNFKHEKIC